MDQLRNMPILRRAEASPAPITLYNKLLGRGGACHRPPQDGHRNRLSAASFFLACLFSFLFVNQSLKAQTPTLEEAAAHYFSLGGYENAAATTLAYTPKGWLALTHELDANGHRGKILTEKLFWSSIDQEYLTAKGDTSNGQALGHFLSSLDTFAFQQYTYFGYPGWQTDVILQVKAEKSAPKYTLQLANLYALRAQSHVWPLESFAFPQTFEKELLNTTIPATAWMSFVRDADSAIHYYHQLPEDKVVLGADLSPTSAAFCLAVHAMLTTEVCKNPALNSHFSLLAANELAKLPALKAQALQMLMALRGDALLITADPRMYYALWYLQQSTQLNTGVALVYQPLLHQKRYIAYLRESAAKLSGKLPLAVWQPANRNIPIVSGPKPLTLVELCKSSTDTWIDSKGIVAPLSAKDLQVGLANSAPEFCFKLQSLPFQSQKQLPLWFLALADIVAGAGQRPILWADSRLHMGLKTPNYLKDIALLTISAMALGPNGSKAKVDAQQLKERAEALKAAEALPLPKYADAIALQSARLWALAEAIQAVGKQGDTATAHAMFQLAGPLTPEYSPGLLHLAGVAYEVKLNKSGDSLTTLAISLLTPLVNVFYATKQAVSFDPVVAMELLSHCQSGTTDPELKKRIEAFRTNTLNNLPPKVWPHFFTPQAHGPDRLAIPHLGLPLFR